MSEIWAITANCLKNIYLRRGVCDMIVSTNYVRNADIYVVNNGREYINERTVRFY
jgi:hypothetical protein